MSEVLWTDLGRIGYAEAWSVQRALVDAHKAGRGVDRLLIVEHEPVITLGRRADEAHVVASRAELDARGIGVHAVERGGDVTWHGPGQLVLYPVLDLRRFRKDVRWYSAALLETLVHTLDRFGIAAEARVGDETGVWAPATGGAPGKIAALGLRVERWIAWHGVALNVDPDLDQFLLIVPCGLAGVRVVSMASLLGRPVGLDEVRPAALEAFAEVLGVRLAAAGLPAAVTTGVPA